MVSSATVSVRDLSSRLPPAAQREEEEVVHVDLPTKLVDVGDC